MTVRSTMKSYCKVIQSAHDTSASVTFTDSVGAGINCNYFSVDCRSGGESDSGFFMVQPSGVYFASLSGITEVNALSGTTSHAGLGGGGVMGTADGSVEMSLAPTDSAAGVLIWNKLLNTGGATTPGTTATFIVTYGNMKQANPKRDQDGSFSPAGE